jgi:AraC family transcriptional regulator
MTPYTCPNFSRLYPSDSSLSTTESNWPGLSIDHVRHAPGSREAPPLPYHLITFTLDAIPSLAQKRGGLQYDGPMQRRDITITPARHADWRLWSGPCHVLCLWLEENYLQEVAAQGESPGRGELEIVSRFRVRDPHIEYLAGALLTELDRPSDLQQLTIESLRTVLAVHLVRHYSNLDQSATQVNGGLSPAQLRRAMDYIHGHLEGPMDLLSIAESTGLSSFHFARRFKRATGVSPHQYVIQQRIEQAKRLLISDALPVGDIAYRVGFSNQSHLNHHFRRLVGVSPTQFQNKAQV